jgi:hypothetical protein
MGIMKKLPVVFFLFVSLFLAGSPVLFAAESEPAVEVTEVVSIGSDEVKGVDSVKPSSGNLDWDLFVPPPDDEFDWIQLTSFEWLKGELTDYYNFSLEFDSDELGVQHFDFDEVMQIISSNYKSVRLEQESGLGKPYTVFGKLYLNGDDAQVLFRGKVTKFETRQIISITKGATRQSELWSGELSLGGNLRTGNSDLIDSNVTLNVRRRTTSTRLTSVYIGNFSKADGVETSNSHRISGSYDSFVTADFFWRPLYGEYLRDRLKNIKHQATAGTGLGYYLIRTPHTEWDISAVVGAVFKESDSVEVGESEDTTSPFVGITTMFDTSLTNWIDYYFYYSMQFLEEESGRFTHHLITTLETDLIGDLDLEISFIWDYVAEPQPLDDGSTPKNDDVQFIVGLGYDF